MNVMLKMIKEMKKWGKLGVDCSPYDTKDLYDLTVFFFKKISKG